MEPSIQILPLQLPKLQAPLSTTNGKIEAKDAESTFLSEKLANLILSLEMDCQSMTSINLVTGRQAVVFNRDTYTFDDQKKTTNTQFNNRFLPLEQSYLKNLLPGSPLFILSGLRKVHTNITTHVQEIQQSNIHSVQDSSLLSQVEELITNLILIKNKLKEALEPKRGIHLIITTAHPRNASHTDSVQIERYEEESAEIVADFKGAYNSVKTSLSDYSRVRSALLAQQEKKEEEFSPFPVSPLAFCLSSEPSTPLIPLPATDLSFSIPPLDEEPISLPDPQLAYIFGTSTLLNRHEELEELAVNSTDSQPANPSNKKSTVTDYSTLLTTELQKALDQELRKRLAAIEERLSLPYNSRKKADNLSEEFEQILNKLPSDFKTKVSAFLEAFEASYKKNSDERVALRQQLDRQLKRILLGLNDFDSLSNHLQQKLKRENQRVLCIFDADSFPRHVLSKDIDRRLKEVIISLEDAPVGSWVMGKNQRGRRTCFIKYSKTAYSSHECQEHKAKKSNHKKINN